MEKSSVLKWSKFFGVLVVGTMFWACSDGEKTAGGSTEDAGIIAIKDLDVAGVTQKGPFVKGSAVTVQGIDCKTLKQTDEHFEGEVKSDKGDFTVKEVSLKSTCALFEVTGLYRSEITGKKSSKELTLRALTDLKDRENVNINILTNLEYERLLYLVTEKGKTFAEAKSQAEAEVLAAFDIAGSFEEFEKLNIFESGEGNAALLAVSVMMQAETDDAGLAKRIDKFADSFAESGNWKDSATKATIADWAADALAGNGLDSIRKNIESWNVGDTVAAFEKYITAEFPDTVVYSSSSADRSSSSAKANAGSEYDPATNTLKDLRDGKTYKTVKIGNQVWMAENLNYETNNSFCYNEAAEYCAKYGRLYQWATAVDACPTGWHLPASAEFDTLFKAVGGSKKAGMMLKSNSGWNDFDPLVGGWNESGNGTDDYSFTALPGGYRLGDDFRRENFSAYFWSSTENNADDAFYMDLDYDNDSASVEIYYKVAGFSIRCLKGETPVISSSSSAVSSSSVASSSSIAMAAPCKTESEDNCEYGTLTDNRDGQTYKTVKIGNQTWMAENLNYADSVKTPSLKARSWCYDNDPDNCEKYGRLYTWAAAIDSVKFSTEKSLDCGYGKTCALPDTVQGICPSGWRLPRKADWETLFSAVGGQGTAGKILKTQTGWNNNGNGMDAVGFSGWPAGDGNGRGSSNFKGDGTYFWSSTESSDYGAFFVSLYYRIDSTFLNHNDKDYAYSVRCVKESVGELPSSSVVSSSSVASSSSIAMAAPCKTESEDNCEYGTLTDNRDDQTYKTVKIGNQVWMAENLNYADSVKTPSLKGKSWCNANDSDNCVKYGRLYTWAAAIDSVKLYTETSMDCGYYGQACALPDLVQGICPTGWHLPSKSDWDALITAVGDWRPTAGKVLKSQSDWNGDGRGEDSFGFSALPAGSRGAMGYFDSVGAAFWSPSAESDAGAYGLSLHDDDDEVVLVNYVKKAAYSVRCLKD